MGTNCPACPEALARKSKFCGECGHKFVAETRSSWKPQVFGVLQKKWRGYPREVTNTDREYWDAPLFSTGKEDLFIGHELCNVNCSYDEGVRAITFGEMDRAREQVAALLQEMGIGQRRELSLLQFTRIY